MMGKDGVFKTKRQQISVRLNKAGKTSKDGQMISHAIPLDIFPIFSKQKQKDKFHR